MPPPKKYTGPVHDEPLDTKDLDARQELLLDMTDYGKKVYVRVTHALLVKVVGDQRAALARPRGYEMLHCLYRGVFRLVREFDDDENWRQQRLPCEEQRRPAVAAWRDFCHDCVILVCLRSTLHGATIVVRTSVDFATCDPSPVGGCLPHIKLRGGLAKTVKRIEGALERRA